MHDRLQAINEIQGALAKSDFDKAADIAKQRIGMRSQETHHATMTAPYMPKTIRKKIIPDDAE